MKIRLLTAKLKPVVIVALMLMGVMAAQAQYSISSFSGKVEVKHAGRMAAATTGMKLSAADMIYIGEGSKVQILDSRDSKLYERDIPGEIGLTSLIFEAKKAARDNASAVHRKVSLGKPVSEEEGKMYVEKGKITLALEEYDPAGENFMIDAKVMARYIVSALKSGNYDSRFPTELQHESASGNLMFGIDNNVTEPLYINVIKVGIPDSNKLRISELGQPAGCYVLLPGQSLQRSQRSGISDSEIHLLVATHYYFSIDELISELQNVMADGNVSSNAMLNLPIYLQKL